MIPNKQNNPWYLKNKGYFFTSWIKFSSEKNETLVALLLYESGDLVFNFYANNFSALFTKVLRNLWYKQLDYV